MIGAFLRIAFGVYVGEYQKVFLLAFIRPNKNPVDPLLYVITTSKVRYSTPFGVKPDDEAWAAKLRCCTATLK